MRAAADPGLIRGAPLPGSSGVSGGRLGSSGWRWGPRGIWRAGGCVGSLCARCGIGAGGGANAWGGGIGAATGIGAAACCGDCAIVATGTRRCCRRFGRRGVAVRPVRLAGSAGGARRPRGLPFRISSR